MPTESLGPWPGWHAVSVNYVYGYRHYEEKEAWFEYYQRFQPVGPGPAIRILIYHISVDEANAVREQMGLSALPEFRPPMSVLDPHWLNCYR